MDFLLALEKVAITVANPWGMRYYASMFILTTMAPLRFCDTRDAYHLRLSESAICGASIDHKSKNADPMQRAAPAAGFSTDLWLAPITNLWKKIKPNEGCTTSLSPRVDPQWGLVSRRVATNGTAQAALAKLERHLGFSLGLRIHSPRTFFATCDGQLRFSREERENLGRWAAGSVMPDRYDREVCVTELLLRNDIPRRINEHGRMPQQAFCVPKASQPLSELPPSQAHTEKSDGRDSSPEGDVASASLSETSEYEPDVDIADLDDLKSPIKVKLIDE